ERAFRTRLSRGVRAPLRALAGAFPALLPALDRDALRGGRLLRARAALRHAAPPRRARVPPRLGAARPLLRGRVLLLAADRSRDRGRGGLPPLPSPRTDPRPRTGGRRGRSRARRDPTVVDDEPRRDARARRPGAHELLVRTPRLGGAPRMALPALPRARR